MGKYIDIEDLEAQYTSEKIMNIAMLVTDEAEEEAEEEYDEVKIAHAIDAAEETFEEYARRRYTLPLTNVSARVKQILCYLAYKYLFDEGMNLPESVLQNADEARDYLEKISRDVVRLDAERSTPSHNMVYGMRSNTTGVESNYDQFKEVF